MKNLPPAGALTAACLLFSACPAHVAFDQLPDASASLEDRAAAYEQLRPQTSFQGNGIRMTNGWNAPRTDLVLNDGTVVQNPRDLAPVLKPNAQTLVHANAADDLEDATRVLAAGSGVVYVAGIAGAIMSTILETQVDDGQAGFNAQEEQLLWGAMAGIGVGVVGALGLVPTMLVAMSAADERNAAFASYDGDLRKRLALVPKKKALAKQWEDAQSGSLPAAAAPTAPTSTSAAAPPAPIPAASVDPSDAGASLR